MSKASSRDFVVGNIQDYYSNYYKVLKESYYVKSLDLDMNSNWSLDYTLRELFEIEGFLRSYISSQHSYKDKLVIDLIQLGIYKKVYKLGAPYYVDISKNATYELKNEFSASEILKMSEFILSINKKHKVKSKDGLMGELIDELLYEAKQNKLNEIHEPVYIDLIGYTKSDISKFYSSNQIRQAIEKIRDTNKKVSISNRAVEEKLNTSARRKFKLKRSNSISISNREKLDLITKETIVEEIFNYSNEKSIYTIEEPYYLNLEFDDRDDLLTNFSEKELREILNLFKSADGSDKKQGNIINPLGIIDMFEDGAIKVSQITDKEIWRKYIPTSLRYDLAGKSLENAIKVMNDKIKNINRQHSNYKEWVKFKIELEEILYEEDVIEEAQLEFEKEWEEDIEIALQIRKTVETIILPHLEILQRLEEKNGKLQLLNVNDQPFNEILKKSVRERDNYSCVVCDGVTNLHVHHKIPRKLGGPNHIYNLVTLCSSCHSAVETADPLYAFTKGITNYFKNKNQKRYYEPELRDPEAIKKELIEKLDALILENRRNLTLKDELVDILRSVELL